MENEKDLLNKDLETTEDAAGLEKLKEDAELMGHEDIVARAQEKINAITAQAEALNESVQAKEATVESIGGTAAELEEKVAPVKEEVAAVQKELKADVAEVEQGGVEEYGENNKEKKEFSLEEINQQFTDTYGENFVIKGVNVGELYQKLKQESVDPSQFKKLYDQIKNQEVEKFMKNPSNLSDAKFLMETTANDPSGIQIDQLTRTINQRYGFEIDGKYTSLLLQSLS